jgi:hypothetical protein
MWFFTSAIALVTAEEIIIKEENSHLESTYWAWSNSCPWLFIFSSAAFSLSSAAFSLISISCARITIVSRADDLLANLLAVTVREAWTDSRSHPRLTLASSEVWKDYSAVWQAAFSSANDRSRADQEAFSSNSTFHTTASSAVQAASPRNHKVSKENQRFEAAKKEQVPFLSVSTSFKLSK